MVILIPIITMDPLERFGGRNWPETRSLGHFWAPRARGRVLVDCPKIAILTPTSPPARTGARAEFVGPSPGRAPAQGILSGTRSPRTLLHIMLLYLIQVRRLLLSSRQVRLQKITVLSWPCSIFERWMGKLDGRSAKSSPKWRIQAAPNHLAWAEFPPGHVPDSAPLLKIHEHVEGVREKQTWPVRPETSLIMLIGTTGLGLVRVLSPHAGQKSPAMHA